MQDKYDVQGFRNGKFDFRTVFGDHNTTDEAAREVAEKIFLRQSAGLADEETYTVKLRLDANLIDSFPRPKVERPARVAA